MFLYRLDKLLHRALLKDGIEAPVMNKARMEQLIKGALANDMVALRIRMSHTLQDPLSFSQLMKEVREEENWISAREGVRATAKVAMSNTTSTTSGLDSLREEVRELSSQVSRLLSAAKVTPNAEPAKANTVPDVQVLETTTQNASCRPNKPPPQGIFCYKCGKDGHTRRECQGTEDLRKVNQKLLKMQKRQGNSPGSL